MGEACDSSRPPLTLAAARQVLGSMRARDEPESATLPRIEGYIVERELGRGAGGVTYLARRADSEAKVALKVLHLHLGDGPASQRAWRELDALQQVRSPSVPRLLDFGTTSSSLYIATEYVEGTPLDRRFESPAPRDADELKSRVRLLERLARAAHTLHERGVIHRDLKPSNVIVGERDEPFIIDLGIAMLVTPDPLQTLTVEGAPVGTPAFMAPEQARGERHAISTRSDVYSLGAIGCWLCAGATPHDLTGATVHEAIRRVGSDPPRDPRAVWPQVPKPLAAVLTKACATRPADRYASAADLADDLRRWLTREPVQAGRAGPWRKAMRVLERHPAWTTAGASVLLGGSILTASLVASQVSTGRLYREPFQVRVDGEHGRWARLESRLGSLHEWRSSAEEGVSFAGLFDAGATPRLRVATVINDPIGLDAALDAQLCIWDAENPTRLLWRTRGTPDFVRAPRENLPPSTSGDFLNVAEVYTAGHAVFPVEVFAESPGLEIIATHHHRFDPAAIRVYSAGGEVLFEAWHWGSAGQLIWLPEDRLIVVMGCNNEHPLAELGEPGTDFRWPRVIFAVRPEYQARRGWINPTMARPGEGAVWYKCVLPLETADLIGPTVLARAPSDDDPARVDVQLFARDLPSATLAFGLDAEGNVVMRSESDGWRQQSHRLAALDPSLGNLPHVLAMPED